MIICFYYTVLSMQSAIHYYIYNKAILSYLCYIVLLYTNINITKIYD